MRNFLRLLLPALMIALVAVGCQNADRSDRRETVESIEEEIDKTEERLDELKDRIDEITEDRSDDVERLRDHSDRWREDVDRAVELSMEEIGRALENIGAGLQEGSDITPVDWRDFKNLLPDNTEGFERVDWEGHNKSALGIRLSTLEAQYERGRDEMTLAIVDLGSISGLARAGYDWFDEQIDSESSNGRERTRDFNGYPGYERIEYGSRYDELKAVVIVEERFVIALDIEGEDLDSDLIEDVIDEIDFRRLRRMAR